MLTYQVVGTLAQDYAVWLIADILAVALLIFLILRWRPGFLGGRTIGQSMTDALDARESQIRTQLEEAQKSREEAARIHEQSQHDIEKARAEAEDIVTRASRTGEAIRQDIERRAHEEYERIVGQARTEIQYERERAELALRRRAADIVVDAAGEIVKRNLDAQTDDRLIVESLENIRGVP